MADLDHVLALEHEAVWTYGLIGGGFATLRDAADVSFAEHRTERDRLLGAVDDPVPPQVAYAPTTLADEAAARERAQDVEQRLAAAWAAVVGTARGRDREEALERLTAAETARLSWGGSSVAFPGLD